MQLSSSYQAAFQTCMDAGTFAAARLFHLDKHMHIDSTGCHKVFLTLSGGKRFHVNDRSYEVQPGHLFLVSSDAWHFFSHYDETEEHPRFVIFICPEYLKLASSSQTDLTACFSQSRSLLLPPQDRDRLLHLFDRLANSGEYGSDLLDHAVFLQIMVFLNRLVLADAPEAAPIPDKLTNDLLDYLNRHITQALTIHALAERFFLSPSHLCKSFKTATGTTIHKYITAQRIARAKELLAFGYPILDVSDMCGFRDYHTFLKAFRREVGMTPRQYARFSGV